MSFVGAALAGHAAARPDAVALSCGSRQLTYSALGAEIRALAGTLASALGVSGAVLPFDGQNALTRQPRVALDLADPLDLLVAFFAIVRAGAVALVLDPAWPAPRRAAIRAATAPAVYLDAARLSELRREAVTGADWPEPARDHLFYAGFTSGSTGEPKGYARSHRSWTDSFALSREIFAIDAADHVLVPGSLAHSLHLYGAVEALHCGACVTLAESFLPGRLARSLASSGITVLYATPTQLVLMQREITRLGLDLPGLRLCLVSGAAWGAGEKAALRAALPHTHMAEFYGASEMSFLTLSADPQPAPVGSVGKPFPGVEMSLRDETGRECGTAVLDNTGRTATGTIFVRSPLLFTGYICGGGSEVRWDGEFLTIGDRGWRDADGNLYLAGRDKRMFVSAGLNLFPEEAEQVLREADGVALAAVFGAPDRLRGRVPVAAIQLEANGVIDPGYLRRLCLAALGRARCPRRFHLFKSFPLTSGGKIDLPALEALVLTREEAREEGRELAKETAQDQCSAVPLNRCSAVAEPGA
ncbi:AMP-binding protein [Pannonibacter carbonis]|uniref:AMP-binding protein n=1 Tax=Pannonibacter carbonis TaxID=2067569 RepID=UPI000D100735|nr:AMP-binding protein [Pannonibacter carbonis]